MQRPESFEKFYYTKVGLGEACGCAEKVIDVYEFDRQGGRVTGGARRRPRFAFSWAGFLRKYGLARRPKGRGSPS